MNFEFSAPTRIIFGDGAVSQVPALARTLGQRVFLVNNSLPVLKILQTNLNDLGIECIPIEIENEPDIELANRAIRRFKDNNCDLVIGIGGGSVLDIGKIVASMATNPGTLVDYLEVIGSNQPITKPSVPYIAIPTTAGTGSEVTRNAVLSIPEERIKVSIRSPFLVPRIALVDPELCYSLPPDITASTGMDALTQCIEPYVCNTYNPLIAPFCREGVLLASRSLLAAYKDQSNQVARMNMCLASLFGGISLANARLGAIHGLAAVLGGMYKASHGSLCACLLPHVVEANIRAIRSRDMNNSALERYTSLAQLITGDNNSCAEEGTRWIKELVANLHIQSLFTFGIMQDEFPIIASRAQQSSSMKGNPITLSDAELIRILEYAY